MATPRRGRRLFNIPELLRMAGFLALIEAAFMLVPLGVSIAWGEEDVSTFAISTVVTALFGLLIVVFVKPKSRDLGKRDGILLTACVWIIFSLFGMLPFILAPSTHLSVHQAFFESMSGFTTTGASVISDVSGLSHGIHIWRCLMQWIGGVGIIIFTVAVLPMLNSSGGMQMFNAELSGITHDKLRPRISQTAKRVWAIYCILTIALAVILWLGPMSCFDSFCHSLSTVSTGGFSTSNGSIGAWHSMYADLFILLFMFIGGINFAVIYRASTGKFRRAFTDVTLRSYMWVIVLAAIFIAAVVLIANGFVSLKASIIDPLFQVVSVATSTGYVVDGASSWPHVVLPVLFALMFIGGCAGSTSGGVKIDRIIYLVKSARNEIRKTVHPNRFYPLVINGTVRPPELINKVGAFMTLYFITLFIGGVALTAMGVPLVDSFFASFSCIGNTGLGSGVTAESFAEIPAVGQMLLSLMMVVGRLEFFTIIILFTRNFWKR